MKTRVTDALRRGFTQVWSSSFARSVGVLVGGTVSAHVVTVLALLVVTRLYTPQDFSALAVFTALVGIVGAVASLRFDAAIPLPAEDPDAVNVLALSLAICLVISGVLAVPALAAPGALAGLLRQPGLSPHLWLFPLAVLMFGWYSSLTQWSVRRKAFREIATSRIAQAVLGSGTQLLFGWLGSGPLGLLAGQVANGATGALMLMRRLLRRDFAVLGEVRGDRMKKVARDYSRFPRLSTLEALSNGAALHLPIVLIAAVAVGPEAGYLNLSMYVMAAPMSLIGNAIAQVYLSRAPEKHREGTLGSFTVDVTGSLLKSGVGPLIFAGIVAPAVFAPVFGDGWERSGVLVSWMTPWFVAQFLAVPLSMALYVTNRLRLSLIMQASGLVFRVAAVAITSVVAADWVAEIYSLSGFVYYGAFLAIIMWSVSARVPDLGRQVRRALPLILLWVVGAVAVVAAVGWLAGLGAL